MGQERQGVRGDKGSASRDLKSLRGKTGGQESLLVYLDFKNQII